MLLLHMFCIFLLKCLLLSVHVLLMHMFSWTLAYFFEQVFIVVRTYTSNAFASWTLAFLNKFLLFSVHLLLEHMLYGHLLL